MKMRFKFLVAAATLTLSASAAAQAPAAPAAAAPDESVLGEMIITSSTVEKLPRIAVLPSLSPDYEDVIVRGVVRRDFELTGLFDVIPDERRRRACTASRIRWMSTRGASWAPKPS